MNIKKYILMGGAVATMLSGTMFLTLANAEEKQTNQVTVQSDGTMVKPDGTMIKPDGTMVKPDGTMIKKDGTMIKPDGTMVNPDGTMAKKTAATPRPMILRVEPNGKTLLRGKVVSVSAPASPTSDDKTGSIVVNSWGGDWTVKTGPSTAFLPGGGLSNIKAGDFVGIQGWAHTSWTIDASAPGDLVRNWSLRQEMVQQSQENRVEARDLIKDLAAPRNWQGTAKSVGTDSFVLTVDGVDYTVTLAAGAKVYNQQYLDMNLADIKTGHTVRFYGTISGTTATAYVVRDISVAIKPN